MKYNYEIELLEKVSQQIKNEELELKQKIYSTLELAQTRIDPQIFKKLTKDIWEFRIPYKGQHYRLLSFWCPNTKGLIIVCSMFQKKTNKTPQQEIKKAENLRKQYIS